MKVICIDGKPSHPNTTYKIPEGIPLNVKEHNSNFYFVIGYECDPFDNIPTVWRKNRFILLSDLDETEIHKETLTQKQSHA